MFKRYTNVILLSCCLGIFSSSIYADDSSIALEAKPLELRLVVKAVVKFFDLFSSRGCLSGRILNTVIQKWVDPELALKKVCLNRFQAEVYDLSWELKESNEHFLKRLSVVFAPKGHFRFQFKQDIFRLDFAGLKYYFKKDLFYKVKFVEIHERSQKIILAANVSFIPTRLVGDWRKFIKSFRFEYLYLWKIRFKIS